ncbi:MAG: glutathione S-transferase family protein [Sphingomonadales bacterium]|nr:glutathione S-transferase family protein [Sphingomonadales bacterium]
MRIYGDSRSGNCLKAKFTAGCLGIAYEWREVDIMTGACRTPAFRKLNPAGQVPVLELDDGRTLAQSNAIMLYLAEGSALIPSDKFARAKMHEWLFWEQHRHEKTIAELRFQRLLLGKRDDELEPERVAGGRAALDLMNTHLSENNYFVGEALGLADIALVAYTRWADEAGFDLAGWPAVDAWVTRIESDLGIGG